jgi:membrane protein DedA with SNARE-associated domain
VVAGLVLLLAFAFAVEEGDLPETLGALSQAALSWMQQHGPVAAVFALYAEESGVPLPVPGDVLVMYIGRRLNDPFWWVVTWLALIAAVVLGASNLYWIARRWGHRIVGGRLGVAVHLTPERLRRAERWFARYGAWALIFGRHVPGFRVPITIVAGTLRVRYRVFAASVAVSTATWAGFFLFIGRSFGGRVEDFLRAHRLNYVVVPIVLAVLVLVYLAGVLRARKHTA